MLLTGHNAKPSETQVQTAKAQTKQVEAENELLISAEEQEIVVADSDKQKKSDHPSESSLEYTQRKIELEMID